MYSGGLACVRFRVCHTRSVTGANEMVHAAWDSSWKTAVLVHIRIWGIPKIQHLVKNRATLCGTAVINFWDLLKYDILLRKSFHTNESSSSNFTNFLPSGSDTSQEKKPPMLSF